MADQTFTEEQHLAILADRVAKETASVTEELAKVEAEKAAAESKADTAEAAKVAAEQAKEKAEQEFADYKTAIEQLAEQGVRKDTRLATAKEAAAHMPEDFWTDEKRLARIVAMDDDTFAGYVDDLKATAPAGGAPSGTPPRQTAMAGAPGTGGDQGATTSAARNVLLGRFGGSGQTAQTGA